MLPTTAIPIPAVAFTLFDLFTPPLERYEPSIMELTIAVTTDTTRRSIVVQIVVWAAHALRSLMIILRVVRNLWRTTLWVAVFEKARKKVTKRARNLKTRMTCLYSYETASVSDNVGSEMGMEADKAHTNSFSCKSHSSEDEYIGTGW